jgi:hypothetical protein
MPESIFDNFDDLLSRFKKPPERSTSNSSSFEARGRLNAKQLKEIQSSQPQKLNQTAEGWVPSIPYGEVDVPFGKIAAVATSTSPDYNYYLVAWTHGEVCQIKTVFVNDSSDLSTIGSGFSFKHYRGTAYQKVDFWFQSFISGYEDDLVFSKPAGKVGVAYTAFRFPKTWVDTNGIPRFQAIVKGRFCYDPDKSTYTDSFYDDVGAQVVFEGTNGSTPADLDSSLHSHTITYHGDADIQDNKLSLDGTWDYAKIVNHSSLRPGTDPWTLVVKVSTGTTAAGIATFISNSNLTTTNSIVLSRDGTDLWISLSSNGTSFDLANNVVVSDVFDTVDEIKTVVLEYTGQSYNAIVDGNWKWQLIDSTPVFNSTTDWFFGCAISGIVPWNGDIESVQITMGSCRYASPFGSSLTGSPFPDSGSYETGYVFSDNSALCCGELATNKFYGFGYEVSELLGLKACKDWCDSLLSGSVPRSRLSLLLEKPEKTEKQMSFMATHAELFWVPNGNSMSFIPDRPPRS